MSGSVQWISRCCLAAALVAGFGPAQAGPSVADSIDAIERASGAGDFANSLKLSADLLERTRDADAGRVAALQARIDAVVDAGEWAKQNGALRELVGRLPDASAREEFVVIAAMSPQPELEKAIADWQRAGGEAGPTRGTMGLSAAPDETEIASAPLRQILQRVESDTSLRHWRFVFPHQ